MVARLLTLAGIGAVAFLPQAPLPDHSAFFDAVREALRADDHVQGQYSYVEESRDVKISRLGKVSVGPMQRYEVYPTGDPAAPYKRLVAVDGVPLTADALAKNDAERREQLLEDARERSLETPAQRARREQEALDAREDRRRIVEDGIAVFESRIEGREYIDGAPVIRVSLTPRPDARPQTREGAWAKQFAGYAWFDERTHQLARAEVQAQDDVSIGWGIVGRLHKGARLSVARRRFGEAWLPAHFVFDASGRTLLFRKFDILVERNYSGYRRADGA